MTAAPTPEPAAPGRAGSDVVVVYLGGFGRSGSTLVERMLGSAPGWTNVGEVVDLARSVVRGDELCGCGSPFSRCSWWARVGEVAFGGWDGDVVDRLAALHRATARQRHLPRLLRSAEPPSAALVELRTAYADLYRAVAEVAGARVVVDASKGPALGQALAGAPGVDLRMLNVVRDPRAVAWSWNRRVDRPHARAQQEQMWRIPPLRAAAQWVTLQAEMELIARGGGRPFARLRYEDVAVDPVGALRAATATLGVPLGPAELPVVDRGQVLLGSSHGLSGNPSRFRSGLIELRRDDGWTTAMPAADRAAVTALTLPWLRAYGYRTAAATDPRPATHPMRSRA